MCVLYVCLLVISSPSLFILILLVGVLHFKPNDQPCIRRITIDCSRLWVCVWQFEWFSSAPLFKCAGFLILMRSSDPQRRFPSIIIKLVYPVVVLWSLLFLLAAIWMHYNYAMWPFLVTPRCETWKSIIHTNHEWAKFKFWACICESKSMDDSLEQSNKFNLSIYGLVGDRRSAGTFEIYAQMYDEESTVNPFAIYTISGNPHNSKLVQTAVKTRKRQHKHAYNNNNTHQWQQAYTWYLN